MEVDGPFLERLAAAVREGAERLSSEVVAVSSNRLGRDLGRRLLERTGGWANVRFLTLLDLARELSSGGLPGTPLGNAGKVALAREALRRGQEREPGFAFAPIALRAGFPAALAALFDDFLDAGLEELPPPGRAPLEPRRWAAIASLYRDWLALPGSRAVHPAQAIVRGAAGARRYRDLLGASRLWLSGFYELTPTQLSLIAAVARSGIQVIASLPFPPGPAGRFAAPLERELLAAGAEVVGPAADGPPASDLARLRADLYSARGAPRPSSETARDPDGSLVLVSAPDEEREVQEAARAALRLFEEEGVPFDRMAITFPGGRREIYAPLADEVLTAAGIPFQARGLRHLGGELEGRALRSLLELLGPSAPPRSRLLDLLGFSEASLAISSGRLERLSRRGGIAAWGGDWAARLRAAARPPPSEDGEPVPAPHPALESTIARLEEVLALLSRFPERGSWPALLDGLQGIVGSVLPALRDHPRLQAIAARLRRLADLEPEARLEAFRAAWEEELRSAPAGEEEEDEGVVVSDLMELRGLRFEAVFLLGAAERSFPSAPRSDPLLPDGDRAALNRLPEIAGRLPQKGERVAEEEVIFAGAVASAARRLQLSYPRSDAATGRSRLPSIFFLRARELLSGMRVKIGEVDGVPVRRLGLTHGDHRIGESLTPAEHHLAAAVQVHKAGGRWPRPSVRRALAALAPAIGRLVEREEMKWRPALGAHDGLVPPELLALLPGARITSAGGSISASRIEGYARCPHQYLHRYILNLKKLEEPEEVFEIPPLERGALAHRILERTYRSLKEKKLLPLSPERIGKALAILEEVCGEEFGRAEREAPVGLPLLWELSREDLRSSLRDLLRRESAGDGGWVPHEFEVEFGRGPGLVAVELEVPGAAEGAGALSLALGGKIDRLDLASGGGRFRVIDYKSGALPGAPFQEGEALQLPLYLLAGAAILRAQGREVEIGESEAAYLTLDGRERRFAGEGWPGSLAKLGLAARAAAAGIESGLFLQNPGPRRKNCELCDYWDICDPRVEALAGLKRGDGRAAAFFQMKEALRGGEGGKKKAKE